MGRPIGGVNKAKPFADALPVAPLGGAGRRPRVAEREGCLGGSIGGWLLEAA